jgi:hypothetical protein
MPNIAYFSWEHIMILMEDISVVKLADFGQFLIALALLLPTHP